MKLLVRIIAMALVAFGLLWSLQGLGVLMWPTDSFMLARREWGLYGAITAGLGVIMLLLSARLGPRD